MKHWMKEMTLSGCYCLVGQRLHKTQKYHKVNPRMPTTYWAQKPIQCSNMETLIEMTKSYGEVPTIIMDE